MPSQKASQGYSNKSIKDFFKPFTIPKNRIPINDVVEEEIIVAAPKQSPTPLLKQRQPTASPTKTNKSPRYTSSPLSSALSSPLPSNGSTPRKKSPTKRPSGKRSQVRQLDGVADENLMHSSPSSSQRRVMAAVAIPSPKVQPPVAPQAVERPTQAVNFSFSSISSFSSVPMSTQSSSKRVMKNGMHAVTNSDSGSEDHDSSDDLADPSTFISLKRRKLTPRGQDAEHAIEIPRTVKPSARQSKRLSDRGNQSSTASTPSLRRSPPRPVYKHSLMSMAKQKEKQEKADAKVRDMEAAFEEATRRRQAERQLDADVQGGLRAAVADDSDEGERMMLAMERTDALEAEEKFYYFRGISKQPKPATMPPAYPHRPKIQAIFENEKSRNQALLTGFVAHFVTMEPANSEYYRWVGGQLTTEPREDLCEAYVEVLRAATTYPIEKGGWSHYGDLDNYYTILDSSTAGIHKGPRDSMEYAQRSTHDGPAPGLRHALRVIEASLAVTRMDIPYWNAVAFHQLALANIDEYVRKDAGLQLALQDTIENLLINSVHIGSIHLKAHEAFFDWNALPVPLQCRAIAALPARSQLSHEVRRMLALHLCAHRTSKREYDWDVNSTSLLDGIVARLKSDPVFAITESTDYSLLGSLISVLDIAIDAGFSNHDFMHSPTVRTPTGAVIKSSEAEKIFHAQIDSLVSPLKRISSRIRDAGTSHLKRTEAKGAIERLVLRLEHTVRTKPKTKIGVFDGRVDIEQKAFLSGFLKHAGNESLPNSHGMNGLQVKVINEQELSDSGSVKAGADDDTTS